jgi:predicted MFS family arabinose efflux permease
MRRVLSLPDFRLLWASQAASTAGDSLVLVVLALYVNDIGTPTDVGIVLAANSIPFVGLLLIGGVWADRLPRHLVMVVTDVVRAGLHGLLAVLIVVTGDVPIWAIAAIEACFGAAEAFFRPAYTGLVPQTVPEDLLTEAQGVTQVTLQVTNFVGPAVGSAVFLAFGAWQAFALDAATFVVSALLLVRVRPRERGERAARESLRRELGGGWRELRARPWAAVVILGASVVLLTAFAPYEALGPAIADEGYGEPAVYGLTAAVLGAGSLAGALLAVRWRPARSMLMAQLWFIPFPVMLLVFAGGSTLWLLVPVTLASGVGLGLFAVWWETALALSIPPAALSRVSAWDWMGSLGLLPVGFLLAGPVSAAIGVQQTLLAGAAIGLVVTVAVAAVLRHPNSGTPVSVVEASA